MIIFSGKGMRGQYAEFYSMLIRACLFSIFTLLREMRMKPLSTSLLISLERAGRVTPKYSASCTWLCSISTVSSPSQMVYQIIDVTAADAAEREDTQAGHGAFVATGADAKEVMKEHGHRMHHLKE